MRPVALLALYALIAALVLPGSIVAQDQADTGTAPAQPEAQAQAPSDPAPAEPAPAPAQPAPAPAEPAPTPEPQSLGDERAEQPAQSKPKAIAAASGSVTIADFNFSPASITINVGDTVTWNNNGPTPHSAIANDGSFDTGILRKGQSGSHTFNQAGSFSYYCNPHPYMKATVVVQAAQSGGDTSGSGSGDTSDTGSSGGASADASQSDDGPTLPNSGSDSGALLVLGALMLLLGIAVHRRSRTG
jgi:LPXTG-motif cell wall-anchored protein